jgi:peptide deformylase
MEPINSFLILLWRREIQTIEIGEGTFSVPPTTVAVRRAVHVTQSVIICVFGREHHPVEFTE